LSAARARDVHRARLVPVDAVRTDDVVEQPALLLEPLHMRLASLVHDRWRNALHEFLPWLSFAPDLARHLMGKWRYVKAMAESTSPLLCRRRPLRYGQLSSKETRHAGTDRENPLDRRRRIRLLPGAARRRRRPS